MSEDESTDWQLFSVLKYKCSFAGCDLEFRRKDRLDAHEYSHSQVKKFKCTEDGCDKSYSTNAHLQRHIRNVHAKTNEIVHCPFENCGKFFDTEARMKLHCSTIHSDKVREFECETCSEKFRRKTQLKQHMFEHTGNYRYTCDKCGKGFLLMSRLKRHESSHNIRKCEHCDATFDKWSLLMAHNNKEHVNNDLKCSICDKEFHSKRVLKSHRKIHTNLDDRTVYECPFEGCTKIFLQRNNMTTHFKSKHENRTFACTYDGCTAELSTKQKLELHVKSIHLNEDKKERKPKIKPAERKDKGTQKISTASKLFNIILPTEFERAIISGQGRNICINYGQAEDGDDNSNAERKQIATASFTAGIIEC